MTQKSLFKEIDKAIDNQVVEFRNSNVFQKTSDQLRNFSETEQKVVNQASSILVIVLPVILLIVVFIFRTINKNDLYTRTELKNTIVKFKEDSANLRAKESAIVTFQSIYEKGDFVKALQSSFDRYGIKNGQVKVDNFQKSNLGGTISRIETNIIVDKLTNKSLVGLLNELHRKYKIIMTEIDMNRTTDTKFVSGKMLIEFYSKAK